MSTPRVFPHLAQLGSRVMRNGSRSLSLSHHSFWILRAEAFEPSLKLKLTPFLMLLGAQLCLNCQTRTLILMSSQNQASLSTLTRSSLKPVGLPSSSGLSPQLLTLPPSFHFKFYRQSTRGEPSFSRGPNLLHTAVSRRRCQFSTSSLVALHQVALPM